MRNEMNEEIKMVAMGKNKSEESLDMQTSLFAKSFWGEKNNGFEVLFQNLRNSQAAVKEFECFLRECTNSEDQYVKQLGKITTQIQKFLIDTSLAPVWHQILKELNEHNSWAHLHYMHRIQELIREVQSYYEDLRKKKRKLRESELQTQLSVETFKSLKSQLIKHREQYHQISNEIEKQSQLLDYNQNNSPSSTPVQQLTLNIQKLEKKFLQIQDDYKSAIEKHNQARSEFEKRFTESCNVFQAQEEYHLKQMRLFIMKYTQLVAQLNSTRQKNFNDSQLKLNNVFTNEHLIEQLIILKSTGKEKPVDVELTKPHLLNSSLSTLNSLSDLNLSTATRLNMNRRSLAETSIKFTQKDKDFLSSYKNGQTLPEDAYSLSEKVSDNKMLQEEQGLKKRENRKFSIFNIEFLNRNKSKKDYSTLNKKSAKLVNGDETTFSEQPDSKSKTVSTELSVNDTLDETEQKTKLAELSNNEFDKQLEQIDELEDKINKKNSKEDPPKMNEPSISSRDEPLLNKWNDQNHSFASSVFNDSSLNGMMSSLNTQIMESKNIPIQNKSISNKALAGSLVTATSLDNNNNLITDLNEKKVSLDFIDHNQDEENFFSEFDDINFESINELNLMKGKATKASPLTVSFDDKPESTDTIEEKPKTKETVSNFSKAPNPIIEVIDTQSNQKLNSPYDTENDSNNISIIDEDLEVDEDITSSDESDADSIDSDTPKKVILRIKPISEIDRSYAASPDVLRQISKNLQLKFNKNNYKKQRNITTYTKSNTNDTFTKSIADESLTSFSSSINNSQNQNSTSPSLQSPDMMNESRSASALEYSLSQLATESKGNIFPENPSPMFGDQLKQAKSPPPPLPPLPINLQQHYQQRLKLKSPVRTEPITIKQNKPVNTDDESSVENSLKSYFGSAVSFKAFPLQDEENVKF